jgi:hypothetical protein
LANFEKLHNFVGNDNAKALMGFWKDMLFLWWGKEVTRKILGPDKKQQSTSFMPIPYEPHLTKEERQELNQLREEFSNTQAEYIKVRNEYGYLKEQLEELENEGKEDSDDAVEIYRRMGELEDYIMTRNTKESRLNELEEMDEGDDDEDEF